MILRRWTIIEVSYAGRRAGAIAERRSKVRRVFFMKKTVVVVALLCFVGVLAADALAASVQGYSRRDGTYVQPHFRTNPDGNPINNYGFPGNYNPNTGRITPGDPERYLERYYGVPRGSGSFDLYQNPFGR
jgi:hypothetical protein